MKYILQDLKYKKANRENLPTNATLIFIITYG